MRDGIEAFIKCEVWHGENFGFQEERITLQSRYLICSISYSISFMAVQDLRSYQVRFYQVLFGLGFVALALVVVKMMMRGNVNRFGMAAAIVAGIAVILALDQYYWILFPFLCNVGIKIPGLPFSGDELGCFVLIGCYFVRLATKRSGRILFTRELLIVYPIFFWICGIWYANPTGLAILGSTTIGARFYIKILLGFFSMHVLSSFVFQEKECRLFFYTLFGGALFSTFTNAIGGGLEESLATEGGDVGSRYYLLGFSVLYALMFSRYSLSQMFSSLGLFLVTSVSALATIASGKRKAFASLLLLPLLRAILTRRDRMLTAVCVFVAFFFLCFFVAGHGALWEVPKPMARSLAVVFPSMKSAYGGLEGTKDTFRENMQKLAKESIRQNPWFGLKGFALDRNSIAWIVSSSSTISGYAGHAFTRNWHSTWLGFAADFGIPSVFLYGLFAFYSFFWSIRLIRRIPRYNVFQFAIAFYVVWSFSQSLLFSYGSGHSAVTPYWLWPQYGILLAIANGLKKERESSYSLSSI